MDIAARDQGLVDGDREGPKRCRSRATATGRKKIEMKKIEKREALQACFSKRRKGMFSKAEQLSVLCGAQVALVVFSPGNKAYSWGSPSVDHVIDRYVRRQEQPEPPQRRVEPSSSTAEGEWWWEKVNVQALGLEELRLFHELLTEERRRAAADADANE